MKVRILVGLGVGVSVRVGVALGGTGVFVGTGVLVRVAVAVNATQAFPSQWAFSTGVPTGPPGTQGSFRGIALPQVCSVVWQQYAGVKVEVPVGVTDGVWVTVGVWVGGAVGVGVGVGEKKGGRSPQPSAQVSAGLKTITWQPVSTMHRLTQVVEEAIRSVQNGATPLGQLSQ